MATERKGPRSGCRYLLCVLVTSALAASALLSACDTGSPAATATPVVTPGVSAPTPQAGSTETVAAGLPGDLETPDVGAPPAAPSPAPTLSGLTDADSTKIYATVVDALLGEKLPQVVYISPYVGQGDRLDDPDETHPISDSILSVLPQAAGTRYELADFASAIGPLDEGGPVKDRGVFITLGPITVDPDDASGAIVRGSIYRKVGSAEGDRYRLARDPSTRTGWTVRDTTQEWEDS